MKIKEVERQTGITSANIRFYEKEGLLIPNRNPENNYREYTEQDIGRIQRIKILRMLGIPVVDIKALFDGEKNLEEIMARRMNAISEEEKYLAETKKVCEDIIRRKLDEEILNEEIFAENRTVWNTRLEEILNRDIVNEKISRKEMNRNLGGMLFTGCIINVIISFLAGDYFLRLGGGNLTWQLIVLIIISIICAMMIYFTAKVSILTGVYLVVTATLTPLLLLLYQKLAFELHWETWFTGKEVAAFWGMMMVYVLLLSILAEIREVMISKVGYILPIVIFSGFIMRLIAYEITGEFIGSVIVVFIAVIYIAFNWVFANMDQEEYNRYFAVITAIRIMNVVAMIIHMSGRTSPYGFGVDSEAYYIGIYEHGYYRNYKLD